MKKLFTLFLTLFVASSVWAYDFFVDGIAYNIVKDNEVAVTKYSVCYSGDVVIPSSVTYKGKGYSVTSIEDKAFAYCGLTSVTIPESVTKIGKEAFSSCRGLTSVTIPESVTSIGRSAFWGCSGLTFITFPENVTSIDSSAFCYCSGLTSVTIPESVTTIKHGAFMGCTGLTSITIPETVTSIGESAFGACTGLTSVTIENEKLDASKAEIYFQKDGIRYHVLYKDSVEVAANDYSGDLVIPSTITAGNTFQVVSCEADAFGNCSTLTSLSLPETCNCYKCHIKLEKDGFKYNIMNGRSVEVVKNSYSGDTIVIPESVEFLGSTYYVTSIGNEAFYSCKGLISVTIPETVTSIGRSAFSGCTGLTSVTIPESVTTIKERAFIGCRGLTSVTIPENVTSMGHEAFGNCGRLRSIVILSSSISTIRSQSGYCWWFNGCVVESITFPETFKVNGYPDLYIEKDGIKYEMIDQRGTHVQVVANDYSGDIVIPSTITAGNTFLVAYCAADAFGDCSTLTSLSIPETCGCSQSNITLEKDGIKYKILNGSSASVVNNSYSGDIVIPESVEFLGSTYYVTEINDYAFNDCTDLTSVTIPESVTTIGRRAFIGCTGITFITFPETVTSIGESAFSGCTGLTSVTIPGNVTKIREKAFSGCTGLTSVTFFTNPENWTYFTSYNFENCTGLTSIYVPCDAVEAYKNFSFPNKDLIMTKTPLINENKNCMVTLTPDCPDFILKAVPNKGYKFVSWSDGNTDIERVVAVDSTVYEAIVEPYTVTATAESSEQGTITVSYNEAKNNYVLTAIPTDGYRFVKWTDGKTANPRTVSPQTDESYVAVFEANKTAISEVSNATAVTIVNGQILVNGEAPAFVVTVSGQKTANANLKAGVYFVVVDGETVGVSVR